MILLILCDSLTRENLGPALHYLRLVRCLCGAKVLSRFNACPERVGVLPSEIASPALDLPKRVSYSPLFNRQTWKGLLFSVVLRARVAELADALDLGSSGQPWGFESPLSHQGLRVSRHKKGWLLGGYPLMAMSARLCLFRIVREVTKLRFGYGNENRCQ